MPPVGRSRSSSTGSRSTAWPSSPRPGTTFSLGSWTPTTGCRPGHKRSEWLQCDEAWFDYEAVRGLVLTGPTQDPPRDEPPDPGEEPPPEQEPPPAAEPSVIEVRARGRLGTEDMEVRLNGRTLIGWDDVAADLRTYRVEITERETIESLQVAMVGGGWPRALIVDRVVIDGVVHQSESPATASSGSWTAATGCGPGHKTSEWLHCHDGHFDYRQARGQVLAAGPEVPVERDDPAARVLVLTKSSVFTHPSITDGGTC